MVGLLDLWPDQHTSSGVIPNLRHRRNLKCCGLIVQIDLSVKGQLDRITQELNANPQLATA